jgi:hypothetical protein
MDVAEARRFFEEAKAEIAIERACHRYLDSLGYQLWANWEIQNQKRQELAVRWLAVQWVNVGDEMNTRDWIKAFRDSRWRRFMRWLRRGD